MKLTSYKSEKPSVKSVAVFCLKDEIPDILEGIVVHASEHFEFKGNKGQFFRYPMDGDVRDLFLVGLGDLSKCSFRDSMADAVRRLKSLKISSMAAIFPAPLDSDTSSSIAEGAVLGDYSFYGNKTIKEDEKIYPMDEIFVKDSDQKGLDRGIILAEAQCYSRDLANRPGNDINPLSFAEEAQRVASERALDCEIWDQSRLEKEGMLALLYVGMGSETPPRFIHMAYKPEGGSKKKIVFVGKGVTFDSGGLCIKNRTGMRTMKCDKTGACNVLAIMRAVAELKPGCEVHGIMGMAENMPDGKSYRPDDIVTAKNGKSIEIVNTDAEGRVTLADSLSYASELKPDVIIDMATLTGAAITALGNYTAGLVSDYDDLTREIMDASQRSGERFHSFKMDDEKLREQIDSPVADVLNSGGPGGGMITAGMFLREFVSDDIPWAHLDIASVDFYEKVFDCYSKGASSFGVRTCIEYLLNS